MKMSVAGVTAAMLEAPADRCLLRIAGGALNGVTGVLGHAAETGLRQREAL